MNQLHKLRMQPFKDEVDEGLSFDRGQNVWPKMRQALFAGILPAQVLTDYGHRYELPTNVWGAKDASSILKVGRSGARIRTGQSSFEVEGWVLVEEAALAEFLSGSSKQESISAGEQNRQLDQSDSGQVRSDPARALAYTTDYVRLLIKAIAHFEIDDANQPKAEVLRAWFQEQVVDGEKISQKLAGCMTTIVRRPDRRKGGAISRR